jgi:hypothetical protein
MLKVTVELKPNGCESGRPRGRIAKIGWIASGGTGERFWLETHGPTDIGQAGFSMKWLSRFAASQKNIDRVAMWGGGVFMVLAVMLAIALIVDKVFRWTRSAVTVDAAGVTVDTDPVVSAGRFGRAGMIVEQVASCFFVSRVPAK